MLSPVLQDAGRAEMIQALPCPPGDPSPLGRQMGHRGSGQQWHQAMSGRDAGKCGARNTNERDWNVVSG